jgi:hypothetical protein
MNKKQIIKAFSYKPIRVESGPVQFGSDHPGIFLCEDDTRVFLSSMRNIIKRLEKNNRWQIDPLLIMNLKKLKWILEEYEKDIKNH